MNRTLIDNLMKAIEQYADAKIASATSRSGDGIHEALREMDAKKDLKEALAKALSPED